jgi:hypothetical protein
MDDNIINIHSKVHMEHTDLEEKKFTTLMLEVGTGTTKVLDVMQEKLGTNNYGTVLETAIKLLSCVLGGEHQDAKRVFIENENGTKTEVVLPRSQHE